MPVLSTLYLHTGSREEAHLDSSTIERQQWTFGGFDCQHATDECFPTARFLIISVASEHKNDSNTHRFDLPKNTFIYEPIRVKKARARLGKFIFFYCPTVTLISKTRHLLDCMKSKLLEC